MKFMKGHEEREVNHEKHEKTRTKKKEYQSADICVERKHPLTNVFSFVSHFRAFRVVRG